MPTVPGALLAEGGRRPFRRVRFATALFLRQSLLLSSSAAPNNHDRDKKNGAATAARQTARQKQRGSRSTPEGKTP